MDQVKMPCPWCNSTEKLATHVQTNYYDYRVAINCSECGCLGPYVATTYSNTTMFVGGRQIGRTSRHLNAGEMITPDEKTVEVAWSLWNKRAK